MTACVQMSADTGIRFRDPFVSHDRPYNHPSHHPLNPSAYPPYRNLHSRPTLTPPPDMNGILYQPPKAGYVPQENGRQYSAAYKAPSYAPQDISNYNAHTRPVSPIPSVKQPVFDDPQSISRRGSQSTSIAPSFQIPKSVNDSGGSLSELAAEITCLFWFEPIEVLQMIEDSHVQAIPPRQLCADARPTTGFRKWVTTILSTTLVAQNVVLLALLFVHRLKKLNPTVRGKPGSEYRLLTVALMLGNKFLDDNTYTNKTWAEVSGIMVSEVHIMEVEFLSNMKYCLFTSAEDWTKWQELLGKFAAFVDRSKTAGRAYPAPILPPASSLHLPMALPSPPASNHASPPYGVDGASSQQGAVPSIPQLAPLSEMAHANRVTRKRSLDEQSVEPAPKRVATYTNHVSPQRSLTSVQHNMPRLPLPNLIIPAPSLQQRNASQPASQGSQYLSSIPPRAMAMVYPSSSGVQSTPTTAATSTQHHSRQQSPYPGSAGASPTNGLPPSASALRPTAQISPSYFLQQRNSPYRPVHNVSTLLYPPPSGALHHRPTNVEFSQMHYQPLGKPIQHRQTGRLPYVSQNLWLDGNQPQSMTPVHQWSGFAQGRQQPQTESQQ